MGPTKHKVRHLEELERHPADDQILPQSTFFLDRVFLNMIKERRLVVELMSDNLSLRDFCNSNDIESENGRLLVSLVNALDGANYDIIPDPYKRFIGNICKPTSVRGLIQVTGPEPLEHLKLFCQEHVNIKSIEHKDKLKVVVKQLPVLWPFAICNLEKSTVLPEEVSSVLYCFETLGNLQNHFHKCCNKT